MAKLAEAYLDLFKRLEIFKMEFFLLMIGDVWLNWLRFTTIEFFKEFLILSVGELFNNPLLRELSGEGLLEWPTGLLLFILVWDFISGLFYGD